jgi:uncharacterized caspase-like protein
MKIYSILLCIAFFPLMLTGCSFFPLQHDTTFYGLIIGINYDTNANINDLDYCEADANSIYTALLEDDIGWDAGELTVLLGSAATKSAIISALNTIIGQAQANDYILLYFSGHGSVIPDINGDEIDSFDETIVPEDALPADPSTYISDDELGNIFSQCRTAKGVVILDCCYSGGIINKSLGANGARSKYIEGIRSRGTGSSGDLDIVSFPVMTASGQNEDSYEFISLGHGVFTYYILDGLNSLNADSNNDNYISVRELFKYAEIHTEFFIPIQHPKLSFPMDFLDILITRG